VVAGEGTVVLVEDALVEEATFLGAVEFAEDELVVDTFVGAVVEVVEAPVPGTGVITTFPFTDLISTCPPPPPAGGT